MNGTVVPLLPESAPFSPEQRAWLNGFLAGVFSRQATTGSSLAPVATAPATLTPLTIYFGSQTGTAESLSRRAAKEAGKQGFAPTVIDLAEATIERMAQCSHVLVIASTYGDGEPADNAKAFHAALAAATAGRKEQTIPANTLASVRYSVCALGDRNDPAFCQCGREFDERLEQLGARRVAARVDCDVDHEDAFRNWLASALSGFGAQSRVTAASTPSTQATASDEDSGSHSRSPPFSAPLLAVRRLNAEGSAKEVNHVEISLAGSNLTYETGDALGVFPQNCPALVNDVLQALGCDGEEGVVTPSGERPLRSALLSHYDLGKPTPELIEALHLDSTAAAPQVIDALRAGQTGGLGAASFTALLKRLQPRLYSISSSPKARSNEVHLTVGAVRYELAGRPRLGVCSTFLANRCPPGSATVPVFVHTNKAFRLPASGDTPIIMIGPGTGIAPFRAFLEERRATGATGKSWLFFGDQRASTDFLYADELAGFQRDGILSCLDTAFSRDQTDKIYVQHRMAEKAKELFDWLEGGAHVYVCGDANRMAKDVHAALIAAVQTTGGRSLEEATAYVQALQTQKRYSRDVY